MLLVSDDILFCGGLYIYILLVMMVIFYLFCDGLYTIRPDVWGFLFLFF